MFTRKVSELRLHPDHAHLYADGPDDDLISSIRHKGVLEPLLITQGGVIISGGRRYIAAKEVGLQSVPVTIFGSDDELDIKEAIVHANKHRVKTKEQLAREASYL